MKKKVLLTFGIPVYNAERYIERLLQLFNNIDNFPYEVIVINDGSKDNSLNICKKYENDKIHVYSQKNLGVSMARNRIIELAKGEWITFIDSDDLIDFNLYASVFDRIDKEDMFCINVNNKKYYNKLNSIKEYDKTLSFLIENEIINSPVSRFYKRKIIKDNNIKFNSKFSLGEDMLFNLQYSKYCKSIKFFNENIYFIKTENNNSLSRKYKENKYEELMEINDLCTKIYSDNDKIKKSLVYIKVKNCISCLRDCKKYKNNVKNLNEYLSKLKSTDFEYNFFLNTIKQTIIFLVWKVVPIKLLYKGM